ncbi:uncharacterized protein LOC143040472 [Oratosquilla oratoria]|uniref:uncharacterized protein LOC143040472 n=1 Tax=Oratosquilla oratoria TaxID=337810 RepID=UPI003F759D65
MVRRADKTAAFAIIPRQEYLTKMYNILANTSKFTKITRNPMEQIKKKINRVIDTINASSSSPHFNKLTGDHSPGHAFGNVKILKPNNPIRPIISQIPTATYSVAKRLNEILTPHVPTDYALTSTQEFLDILTNAPPAKNHIIASLDVESLFTNIDVDRTIQFILDRIY